MTSELNDHQDQQNTKGAINHTLAKIGKETNLLWTEMLEKRYYSTHERIEIAQRYYKGCMEKKRLTKDNHNARSAIKKKPRKEKYVLKYLTERPTFQFPLHIGRDIRIWDYIFPFDSTFKNSNENLRIPQLLLGGLMQIKRLTKFVYSKEDKEWTYHIEQKYPSSMGGHEQEDRNLAHYCEWCRNLGDSQAYELGQCLEALNKRRGEKIGIISKKILLFALKVILGDILLRFMGQKKKMIQELSAEELNFINQYPHFIRKSCFDIERGVDEVVQIRLNDKFCEETGMVPSTSDGFSGLGFLRYLSTANWMKGWLNNFKWRSED
jgi:hypothetical protein